MTISAITQVSQEGHAIALSSFLRNGVAYAAWVLTADKARSIWWKQQTGATNTEVRGSLLASYNNLAALWDPGTDQLCIVYEETPVSAAEALLYLVRFNIATGAQIGSTTLLGRGSKPSLFYRGRTASLSMELVYVSSSSQAPYLRESLDGGKSWSGERPILNNYVLSTSEIAVAPFDDEHFSLVQLGADSHPIQEIGSYSRTRPLVSIVKHPSLTSKVFVAEPSWYDTTYFTDYLRGALRLSLDGTKLYWIDGVRLGTSDTVNEVALVNMSGFSPALESSVHNGNVDANLGDNFASFTVSPFAAGASVDLFGSPSSVPIAVDFDVSSNYAYVAGTKEIAPRTNGGAVDIVRLSDLSRASLIAPNSNIFGHAVSVSQLLSGIAFIFVATNESGQEMVRMYNESGFSPALVWSSKMPATVNRLYAKMDDLQTGTLYVSMTDRLNIYKVAYGVPLRLITSIPALTRGAFFQVAVASNGFFAAALGAAGVGLFNKSGEFVSAVPLSGVHVAPWRSKTWSVGDLTVPTSSSPYSAYRKYFKCITAGTSAGVEPLWAPASYGNVADGGAVWQEVGSVDAIVTGVVLDEVRGRIYAVGVAGGATGLTGRVYSVKAPQIGDPSTFCRPPSFSPPAGSYSAPVFVTLSSATDGAEIRYTTDGSYPTAASTLYSAPFELLEGMTCVSAAAFKSGMVESDGVSANYVLAFPQVATPTLSPSGYRAGSGPTVTILCTEPGVEIRYTTDGSTPTKSSTLYSGPFVATYPAGGQITVKATAFKYAMHQSDIGSTFCFNTISPIGLNLNIDPGLPGGADSSGAWNLVTGLKEFNTNYMLYYTTSPFPRFWGYNYDGWATLGVGLGSPYRYPSNTGMYNSSYTIQAVFSPTSVSGDAFWLGTYGTSQAQKLLHFGTRDGKLYLGHYAADVTGGPTLAVNSWYFVQAVYDISTQKGSIYLNGSLVAGPTSQLPLLATDNLTLFLVNNTRYGGNFAHLAIYGRALSADELTNNFQVLRGRFGL